MRFGFGKASKDPLSDVKAAERWLATLPGADTLAVHSNVIGELERAAGPAAPRSPDVPPRDSPRRALETTRRNREDECARILHAQGHSPARGEGSVIRNFEP
jgi:hypothetical protein